MFTGRMPNWGLSRALKTEASQSSITTIQSALTIGAISSILVQLHPIPLKLIKPFVSTLPSRRTWRLDTPTPLRVCHMSLCLSASQLYPDLGEDIKKEAV